MKKRVLSVLASCALLLGLGVRARLPMRAFVLDGPGDGTRLVIDVAHRW